MSKSSERLAELAQNAKDTQQTVEAAADADRHKLSAAVSQAKDMPRMVPSSC
jgi:hypothetical protein